MQNARMSSNFCLISVET